MMFPAVTNSVITPVGAAMNVLWTPDTAPPMMSFIEPGMVVLNATRVCVGGDTDGNGRSVTTSTIDPLTKLNCPVNAANGLNKATNSNRPAFKNDVIQFASLVISPSATFSIVFASNLIVCELRLIPSTAVILTLDPCIFISPVYAISWSPSKRREDFCSLSSCNSALS